MPMIIGGIDLDKVGVLPEIVEVIESKVGAKKSQNSDLLWFVAFNEGGHRGMVYIDHRKAEKRPLGRVYGKVDEEWMTDEAAGKTTPGKTYLDAAKLILSKKGWPEGQKTLDAPVSVECAKLGANGACAEGGACDPACPDNKAGAPKTSAEPKKEWKQTSDTPSDAELDAALAAKAEGASKPAAKPKRKGDATPGKKEQKMPAGYEEVKAEEVKVTGKPLSTEFKNGKEFDPSKEPPVIPETPASPQNGLPPSRSPNPSGAETKPEPAEARPTPQAGTPSSLSSGGAKNLAAVGERMEGGPGVGITGNGPTSRGSSGTPGASWADRLQAPFREDEIEWRVGSTTNDKKRGMALAYVTNRAIMNRLDEVFGPFGWKNEFLPWKGDHQLCVISVRDPETGEWVSKSDGADNSNMEAVKGGLSDAMKRAAVQWGIGRYLYGLEASWCDLENGRIKSPPKLPAWALPKKE